MSTVKYSIGGDKVTYTSPWVLDPSTTWVRCLRSHFTLETWVMYLALCKWNIIYGSFIRPRHVLEIDGLKNLWGIYRKIIILNFWWLEGVAPASNALHHMWLMVKEGICDSFLPTVPIIRISRLARLMHLYISQFWGICRLQYRPLTPVFPPPSISRFHPFISCLPFSSRLPRLPIFFPIPSLS